MAKKQPVPIAISPLLIEVQVLLDVPSVHIQRDLWRIYELLKEHFDGQEQDKLRSDL